MTLRVHEWDQVFYVCVCSVDWYAYTASRFQIQSSTVEIKEGGVRLRLTVVDTPGFGDFVNNSDW